VVIDRKKYIIKQKSKNVDNYIKKIDKPKYSNAVTSLKKIGYCEDKPEFLKELGLSNHAVSRDRETIASEFLEAGIRKITINVKDKHSNKPKKTIYYVEDTDIQRYLDSNSLTLAS
jgi:hypothetical protein